ncbi:TATA box-binding protein-associated factor RNA polymerase I subunit B [Dendroctonus ponderosae]|nr:TATA box-binding protein-associated factor RNA polymerase I subunit B [Dendroctonus ponderosae]KAH1006181.1 hypothetical protein HUJ05_006942 [Dendroctonus ponderosae]
MEEAGLECDVCGGTNFHKESGHFYCNECQTQSQQVQEHVFEHTGYSVTAAKKIQKTRDEKQDQQLTSWECYNIVLKGLTNELLALGADPQLKSVVRLLWMKYLHQCEVFDVKSNKLPKVSVLGSQKDIAILYNRKKRKRSRSRPSSTTGSISERRVRAAKKRALLKSEYEQLSQSQSLTQDSTLMNSLSDLASGSEKSDNEEIQYNKSSIKELNRLMSKRHRKEHQLDIDGDLECHKIDFKSCSSRFRTSPVKLSAHTLYNILYIGLLIVQDSVQLGDLLRFIREGHVSFECFRHFFDENTPEKAINLPHKNQKLLSNGSFRKRTAELVRFLGVYKYISTPDLRMLCSRYCTELNLPEAVFECAEKLIATTAPEMAYTERSKAVPNYEGRAMSFLLVALKLLFGLDGVTEQHLSEYADILTNSNVGSRMFNLEKWLQFIADRTALVKKYHMPTALREDGKCDSDLYLRYLRIQGVKYSGSHRKIHREVQDYLQVLEKVLEDEDDDEEEGVKFEPSLTPFLTYSAQLKLNLELPSLDETFLHDSLDFLLRPNKYLKLLGTRQIRNGGANEDFHIEEPMYLYNASIYLGKKNKQPVPVKIVDEQEDDGSVRRYLESQRKVTLKTTDVKVFLYNWHQSQQKQFEKNRILLRRTSEKVQIPSNAKPHGKYPEHFHPFERYWMNVPINPVAYYLTKQDIKGIVDKFPNSLQLIFKESCRIIEQDINELFAEFSRTELYMAYCVDFSSGKKTNENKPLIELKDAVRACRRNW